MSGKSRLIRIFSNPAEGSHLLPSERNMSPKDVTVVPQGEEEVWVQVLRTLVPRTALFPT